MVSRYHVLKGQKHEIRILDLYRATEGEWKLFLCHKIVRVSKYIKTADL